MMEVGKYVGKKLAFWEIAVWGNPKVDEVPQNDN